MERKGMKGEGMAFADIDEVEHALAAGEVHLHAKIKARLRRSTRGQHRLEAVRDHAGPLRLGQPAAAERQGAVRLVNRLLRKKDVQTVIDTVYRYCGQKESVIFCDQIMGLGFREAFRAGHFLRQGRHGDPRQQVDIVNEVKDQVAGLRTAVSRRPDHPGREVQQGRRCLVEVQRQGDRGDDVDHLGRQI
jgi:DNA-directed RNA polymerase subunit beta'